MILQEIRDLVADDLAAVDKLLRECSRSEIQLADQMARYIMEAGGKRLRAVLVVLCGHASGGLRRPADSQKLAAVIEFIHTATLLHDDVVDDSDVRRGRETANKVWGNEASVLSGDFFYSRAFSMIAEIGHSDVTRILAEASTAIAEGELLELMHAGQPDLGEERYLTIIEGKTAKLFEAACQAAACIEEADPEVTQGLADFGRLLGAAFQIADDAIDYLEENPEADKSVGDDLAGGRLTLPFIFALKEASDEDQDFLRASIQSGQRENISEVCAIMHRCGAIDYAWDRARKFAERARRRLDILGESVWRDALEGATEFSVSRRY